MRPHKSSPLGRRNIKHKNKFQKYTRMMTA